MNRPNKKQLLLLSKTSSRVRLEFFKENDQFYTWWLFYFRKNFVHPLAPFHFDWMEELEGDKNILIEGFRGSLKSEMVKAYVCWCICNNKYSFIVWQSFESGSSEESVRNIAKMLLNPFIIQDYGVLFPIKTGKDDLSKKSAANFNSTNGVKVVSRSLGEKLRGAGVYDEETGSSRPDLLILDDIDVSDSVANIEVVDKNYNKLLGETIGAMSKKRSRIIFLGNTISSDGIVPRFINTRRESPFWKIFRQPLIQNEEITWDFISPEKVLEFLEDGEISFNQNYMLIPYAGGDAIILRKHIQYFEQAIQNLQFDGIYIGVDPAISEKTKSDSFAIVVTGRIGDLFYVIEAIELKGKDKDPFNATQVIKQLYIKHKANAVIVETVAFQQVMSKLLRAEGVATIEVKPHRDKVTRLMEWQGTFEQMKVYFSTSGCDGLIDQLLNFPNVLHDDLVDAMVYSFKKKEAAFIDINDL